MAYTKPQKRKREESERWLRGEGDLIKFMDLSFERCKVVGLRELCRAKAVVADTKPQQWKKEESKWLRGEGDQIKFIDFRFDRWQAGMVSFEKLYST